MHVKNLILKGEDRRTNQGAGVLFLNELPGAVKLTHVRIAGVDAGGFGRDINPEPLGSHLLPGFAEPIQIYRLRRTEAATTTDGEGSERAQGASSD